MVTQVLRGKIEPLALVDILAYLGVNKESGVLKVCMDEVEKSIIINEGTIIFARSNQIQDRLGDIFLAKGLITQEQYDQGTTLLYEKGYRHGRALVEIGAISPRILWNTMQEQVRIIACSVIPWETGTFQFVKQEIRRKETITLKLPILDLVQDVIRNLDNRALFRSRFPNMDQVFIRAESYSEEVDLEPYEEYLLQLFDGQVSIGDICRRSDYGEAESLRVSYLLKCLGWIEASSGVLSKPPTVRENFSPRHPLIVSFNPVFQFMNDYLAERVGSVGTGLLSKYFEDTRQLHGTVFKDVNILPDGSLDPEILQKNLNQSGLDEDKMNMVLGEALSEYLNVGILAVKKVLGAEHESAVVNRIGSFF